jgi:hypothetical protein
MTSKKEIALICVFLLMTALVELGSLSFCWPFLRGYYKDLYGVRSLPIFTQFMLDYWFLLWGGVLTPLLAAAFFSIWDHKRTAWSMIGLTIFIEWLVLWINFLALTCPLLRIPIYPLSG